MEPTLLSDAPSSTVIQDDDEPILLDDALSDADDLPPLVDWEEDSADPSDEMTSESDSSESIDESEPDELFPSFTELTSDDEAESEPLSFEEEPSELSLELDSSETMEESEPDEIFPSFAEVTGDNEVENEAPSSEEKPGELSFELDPSETTEESESDDLFSSFAEVTGDNEIENETPSSEEKPGELSFELDPSETTEESESDDLFSSFAELTSEDEVTDESLSLTPQPSDEEVDAYPHDDSLPAEAQEEFSEVESPVEYEPLSDAQSDDGDDPSSLEDEETELPFTEFASGPDDDVPSVDSPVADTSDDIDQVSEADLSSNADDILSSFSHAPSPSGAMSDSAELLSPRSETKPRKLVVGSSLNMLVCPECNDPVRMPQRSLSDDTEVRCPWCGSVQPLGVYTRQLAPELEVVGMESMSHNAVGDEGYAQSAAAVMAPVNAPPSDVDFRERSLDDSDDVYEDDVYDEPFAEQGFRSGAADVPSRDPGFGMSDKGIHAKPRRKKKPSIIKMLVQWIGGGVLGIGGALAILYFGFPEKFPKFLPFQPPSRTSTSSAMGEREFALSDSVTGNQPAAGDFGFENENQDLLDSMEMPGDGSASSTSSADGASSSDGTTSDSVADASTSEPVVTEVNEFSGTAPPESTAADVPVAATELEERLQFASDLFDAAKTASASDPTYPQKLKDLYQSLTELAKAIAGNPFPKAAKRKAATLLGDIAKERKMMVSLGNLASGPLGSPMPDDMGILLVAKLGSGTRAQARIGYHSVKLADYFPRKPDNPPITAFGLLDDLMPNQDQNVIILGVIEDDVTDVTGEGTLIKVVAITTI
ncbi:MAG: hypothetical protein R3C05_00925 [Pirellulaceae bacterium]